MKALTIHQPWASLIARGQKRYETRSWSTNYRGPLLIHAGKATSMINELETWNPDLARLMRSRLGLPDDHSLTTLPRGAHVAIGELVGCHPTTYVLNQLGSDERAFGHFGPNRYAWEIVNVRPFPKPIEARGAQGLWECGIVSHSAPELACPECGGGEYYCPVCGGEL